MAVFGVLTLSVLGRRRRRPTQFACRRDQVRAPHPGVFFSAAVDYNFRAAGANSRAVSLPIPVSPPVTITILPSKSFLLSMNHFVLGTCFRIGRNACIDLR